ncbi:MAG: LysR family transcriptional regulator [Erysipelotrichaceae bacterium]|nr:LysR family transcriptional regulator [Erysipelotrichaceae bacterium]MDY5252838.1 LysR family transcriptional regulator [Erysipelotrichaceae bacterium]
MTIRHLMIFLEVYQLQSITKAAQKLHIAQPSISLAIKELEQHYKTKLFDRIAKKIYPTESGHQLYSYAVHIIALYNDMEDNIKQWDQLGAIHIGSSITIGTHLLPQIITKYKEAYPSLLTYVTVDNTNTIVAKILDNSLDIALIEGQIKHNDLICTPFLDDPMEVITPLDHPLAKLKTVDLKTLSNYPFLTREKDSVTRKLIDSYFATLQLNIKPIWESSSNQALIKAVEHDIGIAILPCKLLKKDLEQAKIAKIALDPPIDRQLNIIHHRRKYITQNIQAFKDICMQVTY